MYNINANIDYSDNTSFRNALRDVFNMKCIEDVNNSDLDDESRDELLYDEKTVNNCMTFILETTKDNPIFIELYQITAGRVLSTDLGIGLSILFSYDNLKLFHLLLKDFFKDPYNYDKSFDSYKNLYNHIK
jgi:hypothetical protein|tara:strand:- start:589 stop:981 length:393 start_codon:yes stop_codon:yes gene_type:complete